MTLLISIEETIGKSSETIEEEENQREMKVKIRCRQPDNHPGERVED